MAVSSTMLELGTPAPDFALKDVTSGETISLQAFRQAQALLVMFICNHCPYVKHLKQALVLYAHEYMPRHVGVVAINANSLQTHPQDGPEYMKTDAAQFGYPFPYVFDETQQVAKAYKAACTPDFFLFDSSHKLVYRGQFDTSRPGNSQPVTGNDLRTATDQVLAGTPVTVDQTPSIGCNIKWTPGNEPDYF